MDCSPPGSSVPGIPRQEYWNAFRSSGDLPDPGMEPEPLFGRQILYPVPLGKPLERCRGANFVTPKYVLLLSHEDSFKLIFFFFFCIRASGILVPLSRNQTCDPAVEGQEHTALATGKPGKSPG